MAEQLPTWRPCGAWTGGTVAAVAISPHFDQDGLVLAATAAGLYRATDGGRQWVCCQNGLSDPRITTVVFAPAVDSAAPAAFAATADSRLFQTADGGATWQEIPAWAGLGLINAIAVSPNFATDRTLFVATPEGIFRTQDGGHTWESSTFGLLDLEILCLACAPTFAENELLWAGSALGGFYRSRNAARSWRDAGQGLPDMAIQCIAVSPNFAQDQTLYVGTENEGIYYSTDGGAGWQPLSPQLAGQSINCLAISADGQTLLTGAGTGVYRSVDGGQQWELTAGGAFLALALAIASNGTTVAGAYQEGIFRLPVDADCWQSASVGLTAHVPPLVLRTQENSLYLLDVEGALVASQDSGQSWESVNSTFAEEAVRAVAQATSIAGTHLYAVTERALFVTQDAATTTAWQSYVLPESAASPTLLTCAPTVTSRAMLMLADESGNLYGSATGGAQWQLLAVPWQNSQLLHLLVTPLDATHQTLYALSVQAATDTTYLLQLWQTIDNGAAWMGLADFYADTPTAVMTLPLDPVEQSILLGVRNRLIKLYHNATDGTWAVDQQFLADRLRITSIVTTATYREDKTIYVTTNDGIQKTKDGGATWTPVAMEVTERTIVALLPGVAGAPTYAVELGGTIWQGDHI